MDLQTYLLNKFSNWRPRPPTVEGRTKRDVTLRWSTEPFDFLEGHLLFWVQKKEKMPPWVLVYSGGKTTKIIDNLPPRHPHRFRLKVILKDTAVPKLADIALKHFGNEQNVYKYIEDYREAIEDIKENQIVNDMNTNSSKINNINDVDKHSEEEIVDGSGGDNKFVKIIKETELNIEMKAGGDNNAIEEHCISQDKAPTKWLESQWSEDTSTSTDTDGTSAVCFCMAVRCGYIKQLQVMLEEKPELLEIINSNNGFTPLATAIRKGDLNTVKFLITTGADVNQASSSGQAPLHLAALSARPVLVDLLLESGANFQAHDLNGLRVEHYAVDSSSQEMVTHILHRGGDVHVKDNNGWTPLFRAVTQGASSELIELLVLAGSNIEASDYAGLALPSAARLLHNRQGRERDSILRLVDSNYPHEQALANFTRLTKKISSLHTIFK